MRTSRAAVRNCRVGTVPLRSRRPIAASGGGGVRVGDPIRLSRREQSRQKHTARQTERKKKASRPRRLRGLPAAGPYAPPLRIPLSPCRQVLLSYPPPSPRLLSHQPHGCPLRGRRPPRRRRRWPRRRRAKNTWGVRASTAPAVDADGSRRCRRGRLQGRHAKRWLPSDAGPFSGATLPVSWRRVFVGAALLQPPRGACPPHDSRDGPPCPLHTG